MILNRVMKPVVRHQSVWPPNVAELVAKLSPELHERIRKELTQLIEEHAPKRKRSKARRGHRLPELPGTSLRSPAEQKGKKSRPK